MNKYLVFVGIGFELLGIVGVGLWISSELESRYQSKGLITVGILLVCLISWLIHLVLLMKKVMGPKNGH
ncbi:MAG: hypothetical protein IPK04_09570 [Bdellovibrionales bacterium]|jgi:hypothetical protein|nr:hypothetical protein [Bdellovibrionales bacterium]